MSEHFTEPDEGFDDDTFEGNDDFEDRELTLEDMENGHPLLDIREYVSSLGVRTFQSQFYRPLVFRKLFKQQYEVTGIPV